MKADYADIRSRITEQPTWFDKAGTPRYGEFSPGSTPSIYADEAALVLIECQACAATFRVAFDCDKQQTILRNVPTLAARISDGAIGYGDPPRHGCSGDTMTSNAVSVLEYWRKDRFDWVRDPTFEVRFEEAPDDLP